MEHEYIILFKHKIEDDRAVKAPVPPTTDYNEAMEKFLGYAELFKKLYENPDGETDRYEVVLLTELVDNTYYPLFAKFPYNECNKLRHSENSNSPKPLTFKDLKTLIEKAEEDFGDIDNYVVNLIDARETNNKSSHWQSHPMDYVEVDVCNKCVDIGFYK